MGVIRNIYRVTRSVLFSAIILIVVAYLLIYVLLSIPPVQNKIREIAQNELTKFIGGEVSINNLVIMPFNELVLEDLKVKTPEGETCLKVKRVGAGINLTRLIMSKEIELTYGEIIGLNAYLSQDEEGAPFNIQFIIDAFAPKDKNKPPQKFDLKLRNVVMRKCRVQLDRNWIPNEENREKIDFNHYVIDNLKADLTFPVLKNDEFWVDLRRMAFDLSGLLHLEKLAFKSIITPTELTLENIIIKLSATEIRPSTINLTYENYGDIARSILEKRHDLEVLNSKITPADFKGILPILSDFSDPLTFTLEASGDAEHLSISNFQLSSPDDLNIDLAGTASNLRSIKESEVTLENFRISVPPTISSKILMLLPSLSNKVKRIVEKCGNLRLIGSCHCKASTHVIEGDCKLSTACGDILLSGLVKGLSKGHCDINGEVILENVNTMMLSGVSNLGPIDADLTLVASLRGKDINGDINLYVSNFEINGNSCDGIVIEASKEGNEIKAYLSADNEIADINAEMIGTIDGDKSKLSLLAEIDKFVPSLLVNQIAKEQSMVSGRVSADLMGNNVDNVLGEIRVNEFQFVKGKKSLNLDRLSILSTDGDAKRNIKILSDWVDGEIEGDFMVKELPIVMQEILSHTMPWLFTGGESTVDGDMEVEYSFLLKPDNEAPEFFNLPFRFLVPVSINGSLCESDLTAELAIDIPYIQQGKNKLVRDSRLNVNLDGKKGLFGLEVSSTLPAKKGDLSIDLKMGGEQDDIFADLGFRSPESDKFKGLLSLGAKVSRDELTAKPEVNVSINPSIFKIGPSRWNVDKGSIVYDDNVLKVDHFKLWHDNQFVKIDGIASSLPEDSVSVRLADIDLDYIFDLLKINYVTFGGSASGDIVGKSVFSASPIASTNNLIVRNLSYNGAVLGDGYIKSHWNNEAKEVAIGAEIIHDGVRRVLADGGIWLTRDSLSFSMDANNVPVEFMKPFMSAFTSDIVGKASGKAKLFGSFKDIDLNGRLFADTIAMKLDFTNTWYHGSDSVFLDPGHIIIPSFRLYDEFGNSAILTGDLTHEYFHEPHFTFRITDADRLLCYDTNSTLNPDWYGTIYGNGGAVVRGWPGMVNISVDMDVVGNSAFTFVLNDTQAAQDYHFLTFSDRRKEEKARQQKDNVSDVLAAFQKTIETQNETPSKFSLDIRTSVNPTTLLTLVMDPVAGDKITARGNGAIQVDYESDSEEMQMFGKYTLEEGNYNFSLQDLILRDFSIRPGSTISFNGDPLNANLNIAASYRVNTNLSDLDKSFSTDKDLARTNVPVDALLMVTGDMQHPDITFDIELPTLTQDVERKVKSIVSTDDMMSRQIIYLLALNRFYTPEYMGSSSNGGELTAVASTTLSSQLSNMLGQLTDKFTLSPSFRSDKGDFSDFEVDVALSSRLLNNRLLVNGNFGYRDRNTSSTTFVGDFDIEYLLSRNGNLRLKAYNHFNDQNYYLREALTTQGIGVVFRRDFDNLFNFLRKKKDEDIESTEEDKITEEKD